MDKYTATVLIAMFSGMIVGSAIIIILANVLGWFA